MKLLLNFLIYYDKLFKNFHNTFCNIIYYNWNCQNYFWKKYNYSNIFSIYFCNNFVKLYYHNDNIFLQIIWWKVILNKINDMTKEEYYIKCQTIYDKLFNKCFNYDVTYLCKIEKLMFFDYEELEDIDDLIQIGYFREIFVKNNVVKKSASSFSFGSMTWIDDVETFSNEEFDKIVKNCSNYETYLFQYRVEQTCDKPLPQKIDPNKVIIRDPIILNK